MEISGIQKLTLLDYPGKCACTVFLAGCNLRCPFCHNASLVTGHAPTAMEEEEFFSFLKKRRGLLDGVCVTGGEPTLRPQLPDFLRKIREAGYRYPASRIFLRKSGSWGRSVGSPPVTQTPSRSPRRFFRKEKNSSSSMAVGA